jgi:hypothetical protein
LEVEMDLRALLKRLEWSGKVECGGVYYLRTCPACRGAEVHASDCELAAALASLAGAHVQVTKIGRAHV